MCTKIQPVDKSFSVLESLGLVRRSRTLGDQELASCNVHEYEEIELDYAGTAFGLFGKEEACVQRFSVSIEITVPSTEAAEYSGRSWTRGHASPVSYLETF